MSGRHELSTKLATDGKRAAATRLGDLLTQTQIIVIRKIAGELNVNADEVSQNLLETPLFCLSKSGADDLIWHLEDSDREGKIKKAKILQFKLKS